MTLTAGAEVTNTNGSSENQTQSIGSTTLANLINSVTNTASTGTTGSATQGSTAATTTASGATGTVGASNTNSAQTTSTQQTGAQSTGTQQTSASTSTTTSSDAALRAITSNMNQATKNSTDDNQTSAIVSDILNKSALAFAPAQAGATSAGVYNSSTLSLLSDYARAQATSQASEAVLNYKTGQQQIAATDAGNLAAATKTTSGTTSDILSSLMNSSASGTSVISSLISALTSGNTNTSNNSQQNTGTVGASQVVNNTTGSTNVAGASSSQQNTANFGSGQSTSSQTGEKANVSLTIVCTVAAGQGYFKLPLLLDSTQRFQKLPRICREAYYCWGKPVARLMLRNQEHLICKAARWLLRKRYEKSKLGISLVFLLTLAASVRLLWIKDAEKNA